MKSLDIKYQTYINLLEQSYYRLTGRNISFNVFFFFSKQQHNINVLHTHLGYIHARFGEHAKIGAVFLVDHATTRC
jgi:hypothetical protein